MGVERGSIVRGLPLKSPVVAWCAPLIVIGAVRFLAPAPSQSHASGFGALRGESKSLVLPGEPVLTPEQAAVAALAAAREDGSGVASPMVKIAGPRVEPVAATGAARTFQLSGLLKGAKPLAVIDGMAFGEGGTLPGGWRVERIDEERLSVVLRGPKGERQELTWHAKGMENLPR